MAKKKLSILLIYLKNRGIRTISYHLGWLENFLSHPRFSCTRFNLASTGLVNSIKTRFLVSRKSFDAVVVLHSAFANSCFLSPAVIEAVRKIPAPKAFFIANEYKLLPEKIAVARALETALFITQSNGPGVVRLYREALGCRVASIPSSGLDTKLFYPRIEYEDRPLDIGFRGAAEPPYFGHQDRLKIARYFKGKAGEFGLKVDISVDEPQKRFDRKGYAAFLNRCKAQLGTESGPDYFELNDDLRLRVNRYLKCHPRAGMEELEEVFFSRYVDPLPCRIISGRIAEAAGTKTLQILFEGSYNGYIEPDVHYIALKKDFSNIEDVLAKFRDRDFCTRLIENAYQVVLQELTYEKLIDRFYLELSRVI